MRGGQGWLADISLNILANTLTLSLERYFCQQQPNRHTHHCQSTFLFVTIKKKILDSDSLSQWSALRKSCKKPALAKEKQAAHNRKANLFSGKTEYNHRAFCQLYTTRKKKAQMQVSQKVLVSLLQRIAEVTKAQRRELTWRAGPTPTALTTIHANILCFCWLSIVPFLYASAGMSTSYTTVVCDALQTVQHCPLT